MNLEKSEQDGPLSLHTNLPFVFALLFYLRIYLLIKKVSQNVKAKMLGHTISLQEKQIFLNYFRQNISRITDNCKGSDITVKNIRRLEGTVNVTYLVELLVKRADGSSHDEKIVGRRLTVRGTYERTASSLKLYGKHFLQIQPISYPKERIKAELYCAQKMDGVRVKMPDIIHVDLQQGYIFTKFIKGKYVEDVVHQICRQRLIEDSQLKLFEEIGRGLAEIHFKLKIAHGDTFAGNWIYEEKGGGLYLTDWETAGKGDPAWDLAHLIYEIGADLLMKQNTVFFEKIFRAIIEGYTKVDLDKEVVKRFPSYWMHHALSVSPGIHERIFQYQKIPPPRGFLVLRWLHAPFFNRHAPATQELPFANRLLFRLLKTCLTLYSIILLVSGRTNPDVVIIGNS